eukprot:5473048-Amphidinium_carterae.2
MDVTWTLSNSMWGRMATFGEAQKMPDTSLFTRWPQFYYRVSFKSKGFQTSYRSATVNDFVDMHSLSQARHVLEYPFKTRPRQETVHVSLPGSIRIVFHAQCTHLGARSSATQRPELARVKRTTDV